MKPETLILLAKAATSATCFSALPVITLAFVKDSAGVTLRPLAQYGVNCSRRKLSLCGQSKPPLLSTPAPM